MVKKDRSLIVKKTYLLKMLPPLYQTNLENQLSESELLFLNLLINVLQDIKEVSLEKMANALPVPILFESMLIVCQPFKGKKLSVLVYKNILLESKNMDD
ncbi:MAG: hypothetical protein RMY16_12610 [Nostoc sp. DedQUE12b]|uniref:hypothetical protein n=1 Tax=Nostoc sp. DedQUE12b TaxID=3075398 RepID=UPI002AD4B651|nr:hypothetical protein [Nostoc sp. DedQUE12b]MDZ8086386.1 hypothetical protein [Nostoc sp. DedQUE12b]